MRKCFFVLCVHLCNFLFPLKMAVVGPNKLKCDNFANYKLVEIHLYIPKHEGTSSVHSKPKAIREKRDEKNSNTHARIRTK